METKKGFTLIELLIVMFIIGMITTITLINYRRTEKVKRVVIASDLIQEALRTAQNYSQTGKSTNNSNQACRVPQYYYVQISYSSNSFTMYAFNNCSSTDLIKNYDLPTIARFKSSGLTVNGTPASTSLSLYFYPPFGTLKTKADSGSISSFTTATVTVEANDASTSRIIQVDGISGRIGE